MLTKIGSVATLSLLLGIGLGSEAQARSFEQRTAGAVEVTARDTVGQVTPKRDPQFSAGFLEAGEGIPTTSSSIAAGPTADLVFLYVIADIPLTTVGVKGDIRAF